MMKTTDLILSTSRATADEALAGLRQANISSANDAITEDFLRALEEACTDGGIDFAIAASHAANECELFRDTDFTEDHNAFGMGHPDGALGGIVFSSVRAGARFYVGELLMKLRRDPSPVGDARAAAPDRWDAISAIVAGSFGTFPTIARIGDLNTRFGPHGADGRPRECAWMCDETGPEAICEKAQLLFGDLADGPTIPHDTRGDDMAFSTGIPGLPGGPLATDYPILLKILPEWMTNNRPGIPAQRPRRSVQHGNGNPNSTAASEAQYLFNGAEGRQASYHATCDDRECWVMIPADEVTWQAADGGGPGNLNGFSCEMVEDAFLWADPGRVDRVISVTADFMGRVAARLNIDKPEQHWDFNWAIAGCSSFCETEHGERHNCPDKLRHTRIGGQLAWDIYVNRWFAARTDERQRMGGRPEPEIVTEPIFATPDVPAFILEDAMQGYPRNHRFKNTMAYACLREWTVKNDTPRRQTSSLKAKEVGPVLKAGVTFPGWYILKAGNRWWVLTKSGTRVEMNDLTERVRVATT